MKAQVFLHPSTVHLLHHATPEIVALCIGQIDDLETRALFFSLRVPRVRLGYILRFQKVYLLVLDKNQSVQQILLSLSSTALSECITPWRPFKAQLLKDKIILRHYRALLPHAKALDQMIQRRRNMEMDQVKWAMFSGTPQQVISRIEQGKEIPSINLLQRLAKTLNATLKIELLED